MVKGNRIEVEVIEQMRMANKLLLIHGRKEVKNVNLVKNFISTFEDRFIAIVNFIFPLPLSHQPGLCRIVLYTPIVSSHSIVQHYSIPDKNGSEDKLILELAANYS